MCQPRLLGQAFFFKGFDFVCVLQRQTDVVKAIEQAIFAESLHLKGKRAAVGLGDGLLV